MFVQSIIGATVKVLSRELLDVLWIELDCCGRFIAYSVLAKRAISIHSRRHCADRLMRDLTPR